MIKKKIEKIIIISFIGLFVAIFVGLSGNIILKAGSPAAATKTEINFENRLQSLEEDLASGKISRTEYDSITSLLYTQKQQSEALLDENKNFDKIPDWVSKLGISAPVGMSFDPVFSDYTTVDDPSEGFNSVSLVYTGSYENAIDAATKIAASAKLSAAGNHRAKGAPVRNEVQQSNSEVSYLNYSLGNTNKDYLISVQVEPSGRMIIMVTDNRQLNDRLLTYEPLNNHEKSEPKRKKL
jgi:hypothetical protein